MSKKEKVYEKYGEQTFKPSIILKIGLILGFIIAVLESIFFIPFTWTIWYFNRYKKLLYGINKTSQKNMGIMAIIFLGIIPGLLILIDYYKGKKNG